MQIITHCVPLGTQQLCQVASLRDARFIYIIDFYQYNMPHGIYLVLSYPELRLPSAEDIEKRVLEKYQMGE